MKRGFNLPLWARVSICVVTVGVIAAWLAVVPGPARGAAAYTEDLTGDRTCPLDDPCMTTKG